MLRRSAWAALQRPSAAWRTPNAAAAAAAAAAANPRRAFADGAYVGSKKLLQLLEIEADDALTVPRAKVKSQYLQLAKLHHPDVGEQPSAQRFAAVTDAYKQLLERLPDEPVKAAPGGKEEVLGANGRKKLVKHKGRPLKKSARGGQQAGIFGSAGAIDSINETFNPEGGGGMKSMAGGNQRDAGGYWWMVEMVKDQKEPTVEIETEEVQEKRVDLRSLKKKRGVRDPHAGIRRGGNAR